MKKIFIIIYILIFISGGIFGQFQIDAGNDTIICYGDTTEIGGNPTAKGGVEPYTYSWTTDSNSEKASFYLDDTTKANPRIVNIHPYLFNLIFKLIVKDNTGAQLSDSISIKFSRFGLYTIGYWPVINPGDTISLIYRFNGGIEPLRYSWTPNYHISDTSIPVPLVWPDTTTSYQLIVTDSIGCSASDILEVVVKPVGINQQNFTNIKSTIFPNPIDNNSIINLDTYKKKNLSIRIINTQGQIILNDIMTNNYYSIGEKITNSGMFIYIIYEDNQVISYGHFIK